MPCLLLQATGYGTHDNNAFLAKALVGWPGFVMIVVPDRHTNRLRTGLLKWQPTCTQSDAWGTENSKRGPNDLDHSRVGRRSGLSALNAKSRPSRWIRWVAEDLEMARGHHGATGFIVSKERVPPVLPVVHYACNASQR